jgi:hypothetical protein
MDCTYQINATQRRTAGVKVTALLTDKPEAESKEKHCVWDPMTELTLTSPYAHSSPESTPTHLPWALGNPRPESTLTLCQSRLYPPVRDFGFGLCFLDSGIHATPPKATVPYAVFLLFCFL